MHLIFPNSGILTSFGVVLFRSHRQLFREDSRFYIWDARSLIVAFIVWGKRSISMIIVSALPAAGR
jgi:hypothetical protein